MKNIIKKICSLLALIMIILNSSVLTTLSMAIDEISTNVTANVSNDKKEKVKIYTSYTRLTNRLPNELTITGILEKDTEDCALYENPVVYFEFPAEIEKVVVNDIKVLYDNELKLKDYTIEKNDAGNQVIKVSLEGKQTQYSTDGISQGTNIRIVANVIAKQDIKTGYENLTMVCNTATAEQGLLIVNATENAILNNVEPKKENGTIIYANGLMLNTRSSIGSNTLKDGDTFTLTTDDIVGNQERVSVTYKNLINNLKVGDHVLINNGLIILEVEKLKAPDAICKVLVGGEVSDKKSMNFPNKVMDHAFLSEQDKKDLLFGIKNDVDFVAASFVSVKKDVEDMRKFLDENGGEDIDIIAKIENRSGVELIEEICEIANGVMIARGDLGVEIPGMEVPAVQKYLISKCRMLGKRVITATEMLESMIHNPRPTRAELSDVANAVYDGSSAIMLSGESAAGKYPVDAVRNMAEIAEYTESQIKYTKRFRNSDFETRSIQDAISHATCAMAVDVQAKCIVASTLSGTTARMVSRFRCPVDIIGMTTSEKVWRKLNLSWGVTPVLCEEFSSMEVMFYHAMKKAKEVLSLQTGDAVVLTGGLINGKVGNTNVIKVETVK